MIAAHPGCSEEDMKKLKSFANQDLKLNPEQVQVFTPTPSTYSTLMYYTEVDPWNMEKIYVEKDPLKKQRQKDVVTAKSGYNNKNSYNKSTERNRNNKGRRQCPK